MKQPLLIIAFLICSVNIYSTNYYISSSTGNDSSDGKSETSAWQSINKLNTILGNLLPGDSVLFKRGDTFVGQLILTKSGTNGSPIYFGSYGTGNKPIITGRIPVTTWTDTGGNIWTATNTGIGKVTNLFIGDKPQTLGRWPKVTDTNKGYRTYNSHTGLNSITDNSLTSAVNWVGAECAIRINAYTMDKHIVSSQSGGVITFADNTSESIKDNYGYFFQNDPKTLTEQGEWAYNSTTKIFSLYSTIDPNTLTIETTNFNVLLNIETLNYITIENITFDGSGTDTIYMNNCDSIILQNNEITYSGENGVTMKNSNNSTFSYNSIDHTNNNAFFQRLFCNNFTMVGNTVTNTALVAGRGRSTNGEYSAIVCYGNNQLIEGNVVDSVGYIGILFRGDNVTVNKNIVSNYGLVLTDGGGIYTWNGDDSYPVNNISYVTNNIVFNGIDSLEGTALADFAMCGIYMDDGTVKVNITNNTVFNCNQAGIYDHNSDYLTITDNNVYNCGSQLFMYHDSLQPTHSITNCVIQNNNFVSRLDTQRILFINSLNQDVFTNTFDNNYYCRPLKESQSIVLYYNDGTNWIFKTLSLSEWQSQYSKDLNSNISPIALNAGDNPDDYIRLEYNATKNDKVINIGQGYFDAQGNISPSSLTLKPFTSVILFKNINSVNHAPVAVDDAINTTQDVVFTSTVNLIANDTDVDGDTLSAISGTFTTNQGGSLVLATDGSYTYTPKANFNGIDTVNYTVSDGALTAVGTLTITVAAATAVNHAPVAVDDTINTTQDAVFTSTVNLIANDTDVDGDTLSAISGTFTTDQGGSLVLATDGSYTYTTLLNFNGVDTVNYTASDGALTAIGTLTITVAAKENNANGNVPESTVSNTDAIVYPSIVQEELNLKINNDLLNICHIYNSNGQFIKTLYLTKGVNTFNLSNLAPGVYILQMTGNQGSIVKKIIKA